MTKDAENKGKIEKKAPQTTPQIVSKEKFDELTDVILDRTGTPRRFLYEYPYNEFDSRNLIVKAQATVIEMLNRLGLKYER